MADEPDEKAAPAPAPAAEPEWATALRHSIEELPGKLVASVTDDDKRGIAETVHDLFDSSGAFKAPDEPAEKDKEGETVGEQGGKVTPDEAPPKKRGRFSHIAQKFAGD
jgi:hypothetical protein